MGPGEDRNLYSDMAMLRFEYEIGPRWAELVERISHLPLTDPMRIAFTLTLKRLHRQLNSTEPYHPACPLCASHLLAAYDGGEQGLLDAFDRNLADVQQTIRAMRIHERKRRAA